ncbi:MAG: nuclease domain-containing protein [Pseudomonadota bacterium]|nr:nuclease domain-containing protein [Pseudomonadota bacterium]
MSKITKYARGQECSLRLECCNYNTETTVWAHISIGFNSGMGMKPVDIFGVFACSDCHDALDGRSPVKVGYDDKLRALIESQNRLIKAGLVSCA